MIVIIRDGAAPEVSGSNDLGELRVHAGRLDTRTIDQILTTHRLGAIDDSHTWLDVAALRSLAVRFASAADWDAGGDAMLGYAHEAGWLSDDGSRVRAHLDRSPRS